MATTNVTSDNAADVVVSTEVRHDFADGKYTVINDNGKLTALRHGEPWARDLIGDNLVYWMLVRVDQLVAENKLLWVSREEPSQRAALYMSECNRLEGERDEYRQKYNDTLAALGDCSEGHAELGAENEGLKESFESVLSQLKERDAELEQAKKDATRYRWLVSQPNGGFFHPIFAVNNSLSWKSKAQYDAAIDAAIAKEQS